MRKSNDGTVSAADLVNAIAEIKRGGGEKMMPRLFKTDPELATYIEVVAAHLTNHHKPPKESIEAMADALDRILVIVRAIELGHYRMWKDAIPPSSPLARLMDPGQQNGPKNEQKNGCFFRKEYAANGANR